VTPEQVCFPSAVQAGELRRHTQGRNPETVYLLTSRENLSAQDWLKLQRQYWGIENGLHQRLDISAQEDRCRVRNKNAVWILGMFRRLTISFFCQWKNQNPPQRLYLPDFHDEMNRENQRRGFLWGTSTQPSFPQPS
jgi:predicted transposase YbfD/YdcC